MARGAKLLTDLQVGEDVVVKFDDGREWKTTVKHGPTQPGGPKGDWMAWLKGISGCYLLERVRRPLPDEQVPDITIYHQERRQKELRDILTQLERWQSRNDQERAQVTPLYQSISTACQHINARLRLVEQEGASASNCGA